MKLCPNCKKEIQERAVKCKYCKKYLDNECEEKINIKKLSDKSDEIYKTIAIIIFSIWLAFVALVFFVWICDHHIN